MTDEHRKTLDNLLDSLEDGLVNHLGGPPKNANSERLQREVSALRAVLNGLTITVSVADGEDPEDVGAVLHFVADRIADRAIDSRGRPRAFPDHSRRSRWPGGSGSSIAPVRT